MSEDLPILIEIVDTEERITQVLPVLDEMIGEGLVTLEAVEDLGVSVVRGAEAEGYASKLGRCLREELARARTITATVTIANPASAVTVPTATIKRDKTRCASKATS